MDINLGGVVLAAAFAAIAFGVTRAVVSALRRRRAPRKGQPEPTPTSRQVRRARERQRKR